MLKKWQTIGTALLLKKWQKQSHGWTTQKMAETESRLVGSKNGRNRVTAGLLKKWQTQSHDWSAQKMAETDRQTDTHTHRQVSPLYSSEI